MELWIVLTTAVVIASAGILLLQTRKQVPPPPQPEESFLPEPIPIPGEENFTLNPRKLLEVNNSEYQPIRPRGFTTGLDRTPMTKSANLCDDSTMYSLTGDYVKYGSQVPDNCVCCEFVQAP